jgi:hypothetical protein
MRYAIKRPDGLYLTATGYIGTTDKLEKARLYYRKGDATGQITSMQASWRRPGEGEGLTIVGVEVREVPING